MKRVEAGLARLARLVQEKNEREKIYKELQMKNIDFSIVALTEGNDGSRLIPFSDLIERTTLLTVQEVSHQIPIKNVWISFVDEPDGVVPEYGTGGYSYSYDHCNSKLHQRSMSLVKIRIDPESENISLGKLNFFLRRSIRHELHHDTRFDAIGRQGNSSLFQSFIFEGLATAFEVEGSVGEKLPPFATALTKFQIHEMLERARFEFNDDFSKNGKAWMFGSREKGIPHWAGYSIGYYLVEEYLKTHPGEKASTLFATPAEAFLPTN